jgi:molybdate transport system ATP-binding protein
MSRPALLLLDEPFDGLDSQARRAVKRAIALPMTQGGTVLVSAQRAEDIPEGITEALIIDTGKIERRPLPVPVPSPISGSGSVVPFMPGAPLFQLSGVDVFIESQQVLYDINWKVCQGERWAVTGRNGSGKSTLLRLLCGEEFAAYGGNMLWCGKARPALEDLRRDVGYVSDRLQDSYDYDLSAVAVVISGLRGHIGLYEEPDPNERALAQEQLTRLDLGQVAALPFFSLSSGVMRRVLLARALVARPSLLLLDEPCSGLDAAGRALFFRTLEDATSNGLTLIYVSHREQDIRPLFTHELTLDAGRVAYAGPRSSLYPAFVDTQ